MKNLIAFIFLSFFSLALAKKDSVKTVHLKSDEMDLYIDIPDTSEVQTFDVHKAKTLFGKKAIVSIYLHEGNALGDIYLETFEKDLKELDAIKDHGTLKNMFKSYYRHTQTDLIMEFEDPKTKEIFYEFHYVTELNGRQYYICSDPSKRYSLDQVLAMHAIAETLREKK